MESKLNLLVLPGMFPRYAGDIYGIFVLDYLSAVKEYCNIKVVAGQVRGDKTLRVEQHEDTTLYRFSVASERTPATFKQFLYPLWFIKTWRLLMQLEEVDLVHSHRVAIEGVLACLFAKRRGIPIVITVHTGPFSKLLRRKTIQFLTRWVLEKADAVLVVSEDLKQQILDAAIRPKKVYVTYNPVDTELFSMPDGHSAARPNNMLFIGRLEQYKGGLRVLRAFQKIHSRYHDWTLTIVGDGPEMPALKQVLEEDEALAAQVVLKGKQHKTALVAEMHRASFFVYPSEHETCGIVIAEAMATGLPVIVGNLTAPKEFVDPADGMLIPPQDVDAIAAAIESVIARRDSFDATLIRNKVVDRFGFTSFGRRLKGIYHELLHGDQQEAPATR